MSKIIIDFENKEVSHGVILEKIKDNLYQDNGTTLRSDDSFDMINVSGHSLGLIKIIIEEFQRYRKRWDILPDNIRKAVCDYLSGIGLDEIDG